MTTTVLDLYISRGFEPKRKTANEHSGPCPWCGGTDRFTIFDNQGTDQLGRYWCRQCRAMGDAIQFLRETEGLTFKEARERLGMADTWKPCYHDKRQQPRPEFEPQTMPMPGEIWQEKARKLVDWASAKLEKSPGILHLLRSRRGLSLETIRMARLGWISDDIYRPRETFGLPRELKQNGKPKKLWIPCGLVIPVFSSAGEICRVKFRLGEHGPNSQMPKYIPLPQVEKNTAPMVIDSGQDYWQIVESELDALLLAQECGEIISVAALGSASFKPDAELWARLKSAQKVLISLDFDDAGNRAACQWWPKNLGRKALIWPVPEGKDPTDAWLAGWDLKTWALQGLEEI